ncbi:unnamed protein product [Acanthoscelides obtectus]|uniref:Uncharacterized protein n=1 Tax=Acanthoscelides obtectus TaxID=200917 RepID=A0A9P0LGR8_ACAOB|nr:unnamed protein product [Acanthoscelides obtectus]CAK1627134.1 hypothetical protein AOBTE_LOCUS4331 [Acanthoscelides obtectus]
MEHNIDDMKRYQQDMRNDFNTNMTVFAMELQQQKEVQEEMRKDIRSINKTVANLQKFRAFDIWVNSLDVDVY